MKRIKMAISLILAMAIMCVSVSPAFAQADTERELYDKMCDLYNLCEEAHFAYGIGYSLAEIPEPGSSYKPMHLSCLDTTEAEKAWEEACLMVEGYFDSYIHPYDGEISIETATEKFNTLHDELYKVVIDRSEIEKLVVLCEKEQNYNSYYDSELWNDFQSEIAQAKEVIADESVTDLRVNSAYYELMYQFNLICSFNEIPYDVDCDGGVSILDATYIQLYLVEFQAFNNSQLLVVDEWQLSNVSILHATWVQKLCAELETFSESAGLDRLLVNINKSNPESESFELCSFMYNYIYYLGENYTRKELG